MYLGCLCDQGFCDERTVFFLFLIHETGENWAENGLIYDDAIVEND